MSIQMVKLYNSRDFNNSQVSTDIYYPKHETEAQTYQKFQSVTEIMRRVTFKHLSVTPDLASSRCLNSPQGTTGDKQDERQEMFEPGELERYKISEKPGNLRLDTTDSRETRVMIPSV